MLEAAVFLCRKGWLSDFAKGFPWKSDMHHVPIMGPQKRTTQMMSRTQPENLAAELTSADPESLALVLCALAAVLATRAQQKKSGSRDARALMRASHLIEAAAELVEAESDGSLDSEEV